MIFGIGSDLIDIRRIESTLECFGTRFTQRVFTEIERCESDRRASRAASYAKRFAAKEAFLKALGTGLHGGICWIDVGVVNRISGKPVLEIAGKARSYLFELLLPGYEPHLHLTISDDYPIAQAFVVIEARSPL
ncbi:MAG: holo-ACP synthase [Alphaproteobacteria bacterium]|nr:holo-ACP synthase [Alphaproteobacteria bacterium]